MPYIHRSKRAELDGPLAGVALLVDTPGELNYCITRLCLSQAPQNYAGWNALVGVLECVKLELYRRAVAPYEDSKISENGDVRGYERSDM
jgi:hypothetical protein